MNAKAEQPESSNNTLDIVKWVIVALILSAGVVANIQYGDQPLLYRALAWLVVGGVCIGLALITSQGKAFVKLSKEARTEIRKVVWPTPQETHQTTLIVVVVTLIAALILWGLDSFFSWVASLIIS